MDKMGYPELEEVIRRVRGVASVRVLKDEQDNIAEVHVVADPRRNPKQLVRDIESAVVVQMGLNLDHKKISVVQLESEPRSEASPFEHSPAATQRPLLVGLSYHLQGSQVRVEVHLEVGGETYSGAASSDLSLAGLGVLAAGAVLKALGPRLENLQPVRLAEAVKVRVAFRDAWLVVVETAEGPLVGAALVVRDDLEAAAEATLAALSQRAARRSA